MSLFQTPAVSGTSSGPLQGWWGWCQVLPRVYPSALPAKRGASALSIPPATTLCPLHTPLTPHACPSLLLWSCSQAPFGHSTVGSTRNSSCFQIHTGLPGEINQSPLTTSFLQTQGAWLSWGLHSWFCLFLLWEQPRENWLCSEFRVSGGDAAFQH